MRSSSALNSGDDVASAVSSPPGTEFQSVDVCVSVWKNRRAASLPSNAIFAPRIFAITREHVLLPGSRERGRVDLVEGVLLEIDRVEKLALQVDDEIVQRRALLADDLHHLADIVAVPRRTRRASATSPSSTTPWYLLQLSSGWIAG